MLRRDQLRPRQTQSRERMIVIAALPREGRLARQIRRAFVAAGGKPRCMGELLRWAYPALDRFEHWHRGNVRRVLPRYAEPVGRSSRGRGLPVIWAPLDATCRNMTNKSFVLTTR
jgi:hypothetical protein